MIDIETLISDMIRIMLAAPNNHGHIIEKIKACAKADLK